MVTVTTRTTQADTVMQTLKMAKSEVANSCSRNPTPQEMESSYEKLKMEEHRPHGGCRFDLLAFCLLPVCLLPFCLFPFRLHLLFNTSSIILSLYSLFDSRILSHAFLACSFVLSTSFATVAWAVSGG